MNDKIKYEAYASYITENNKKMTSVEVYAPISQDHKIIESYSYSLLPDGNYKKYVATMKKGSDGMFSRNDAITESTSTVSPEQMSKEVTGIILKQNKSKVNTMIKGHNFITGHHYTLQDMKDLDDKPTSYKDFCEKLQKSEAILHAKGLSFSEAEKGNSNQHIALNNKRQSLLTIT